jgi:hypothetical protein
MGYTKHELASWLEKRQTNYMPEYCFETGGYLCNYNMHIPLKLNHVLYKELNFFQTNTFAFQLRLCQLENTCNFSKKLI